MIQRIIHSFIFCKHFILGKGHCGPDLSRNSGRTEGQLTVWDTHSKAIKCGQSVSLHVSRQSEESLEDLEEKLTQSPGEHAESNLRSPTVRQQHYLLCLHAIDTHQYSNAYLADVNI